MLKLSQLLALALVVIALAAVAQKPGDRWLTYLTAASSVLLLCVVFIADKQQQARLCLRHQHDKTAEPDKDRTLPITAFEHSPADRLAAVVHQPQAPGSISEAWLNALPMGVIITDETGRVVSINEKASQLLRCDCAEPVGMSARAFFPAYNDTRNESFINALKEKATGRFWELILCAKDGTEIPVDLSVSEDTAANTGRLVLCLVDATDRHKVEALKKEVISVVSHDLRSPLTSIGANVDLLLMGSGGTLNTEGTRLVEGMRREIRRLMRLINSILEIERMESGKFELTLDMVPLPAIAEAAEQAVAGLAKKREVTITSKVPDIDVRADGERMVQVLVNLLTNAIKFSPEGQSVIVHASENPPWLELKVSDHGRGIPEEYKETIFEKFRQVSRDDKRKLSGGTGLGLPICKTIIEGHGGMIGFDSKIGEGTTFWIRLPLV